MQITEFTIKYYEKVYYLWQNCEGVGLSRADSKDSIARYLERNPGMSFVALEDGRVAGAVLCGHDGRRASLNHLAVHPDFRKRGIAKALVEKCLAALAAEGIQKCHIFVYESNGEGIAFWKKLGWKKRNDIGLMSFDILYGKDCC
jgi:putative acetyltransferase